MTNKISASFIFRALIWLVLNYSFVGFKDFYDSHSIILQIVYALNTFLTANLLISLGHYIVVKLYTTRHANHSIRGNFVLGITRVATVCNVLFFVVGLMIALGINPKEFVTSLTIVAMAIAVIFREYITNMISGLIIMFSDQFSIGDRVKIGEYQGKIVDITLANIVVKDEDDDAVLVPNNLIFTATIVNKTSQKSNKIIIKFELPVNQALDIETLSAYLSNKVKTNSDVAADEGLYVKVAELGKDYVKYKVEVTAISASNKVHQRIQNRILNDVLLFDKTLH